MCGASDCRGCHPENFVMTDDGQFVFDEDGEIEYANLKINESQVEYLIDLAIRYRLEPHDLKHCIRPAAEIQNVLDSDFNRVAAKIRACRYCAQCSRIFSGHPSCPDCHPVA